MAEHTEKVAFNKFENCWNAVLDLTADDKLGGKSYSILNPDEFKYNHELPPVFPIDYEISPISESKPPQTIFKHDTEFERLRIVKIANVNIKEAHAIVNYWLPPVGWDRHTSYSLEAKMLHTFVDEAQKRHMRQEFG